MMSLKKIILIVIAVLSVTVSYAQQDAMFTHYMYNTLAVNPAYSGSREALTVTALNRNQWVGIDGAPTTQTLTIHSPLMSDKLGIGAVVVNDKIGPINTTAVYGSFAYRILFSNKKKLSFGLNGGVNMMQGKLSTLQTDQAGDIAFYGDLQSKLLPNFGFGMYYSTEKWYTGISVPKLLENDFQLNSVLGKTNIFSDKRHFYLIAGTVLKLNENLKFKPTTYFKITKAAPIEADVTPTFVINDKLEVGAMFRTGDAFGLLAGYNITEQLYIGYSFDFSYGHRTFKYNGGSHEVLLRYDFIYKSKDRVRSPRYF